MNKIYRYTYRYLERGSMSCILEVVAFAFYD